MMTGPAKWTNRLGWCFLLSAVLMAGLIASISLTAAPGMALEEAGTSVFLNPPSQSVLFGAGKTAAVSIMVANVIDLYGSEIRLTFDKNLLAVQDADATKSGVQLAPSSAFFAFQPENRYLDEANNKDYYYQYSDIAGGYFIAESEANNSSGNASYIFTLLSPLPPAAAGAEGQTLATVTFNCLAAGEAHINIDVMKLADAGGSPKSIFSSAGAAVQIIQDYVNINVLLQGGSRPDSGWVVPLTVKFFTPGTTAPVDVLTATPVYTFSLTTAKSGSMAIAQAAGVAPGTYDISAASEHCLCSVKRSVVIGAATTDVNMGTLLEGDANGSHIINIQDFGILAATYGKAVDVSGYDARADFNRSGNINIADFGLLASNYGKYSPIETP
jgi:hypothetical protein